MKTLVCLAALLCSFTAFADVSCREESLVHFFSGGSEVASELIGADDACDHFGGNLVYSPLYGIFLYVNFNIKGNIDLDLLDESFATYAHPDAKEWLKNVQLAVVDGPWMLDTYGIERDAILNYRGDSLFIHERLLAGDGLARLWKEFYNTSNGRFRTR